MADWADEWKRAKANFEKNASQKKPSDKTKLGFRKGSGLEDALNLCDKAFAGIGSEKDAAKKLAAITKFEVAIKQFDAKGAAYEKILLGAIEATDSKLVKPELDILWKQLHALSATMKSHAKAQEVGAKQVSGLEFLAKTMVTSLAGAISRAKLFAAKATASKDEKIFNAGIMTAARDITQSVGNVEKLRAKGYVFPNGDPTKFFTIMTPWAQGKRTLKNGASAQEIKRETGAFLQAIEGVKKWVDASA